MSDGDAPARALVLGGGGVAGIAWETGVLAGLADSGVDVRGAELIVGTSAGAAVAAQITSDLSLDELVARQQTPPEESGEIAAELDIGKLTAMFVTAIREATTPIGIRAAIGRAALAADTVAEAARRAVIEHRLPSHSWPARRQVRIVAVDAADGEVRVFDGHDDVSLVDAVAASCAVPGVWPPVTIGGRRYVDGGVPATANADLASACEAVLVLAPTSDIPGVADPDALAATDALLARPRTLRVGPDEASLAAIGLNPLDPATRGPSVVAGRAQGRAIAPAVRAIWEK